MREYVEHYHRERHHQGLDNQLWQRPPPPVSLAADVQRRARLGGLLNFYHREATGVVGRLNAPYGSATSVQLSVESAPPRLVPIGHSTIADAKRDDEDLKQGQRRRDGGSPQPRRLGTFFPPQRKSRAGPFTLWLTFSTIRVASSLTSHSQ